jgi:hypothetical protein
VKRTKKPKVITTLETILKIIVDFEFRKRAVIRNIKADLHCCKEVLTEMNKPRIQLSRFIFFVKTDD